MGKRNAIDLEDNFNNYPETEDCSDESNCYFKQK